MIPLIAAGVGLAAEFLPALIHAITGSRKGGEIAGRVAEIAMEATGLVDPAAAAACIREDAVLRERFLTMVQEHEKALLQIEASDRADARAREVAMASAGHRDFMPPVLVAAAFFLILTCLGLLSFVTLTPAGEAAINTTLGVAIGTCFASVYQYYFGSSAGSARKTDIIAASRPPA